MVNDNLAEWVFNVGDWAWCCGVGWVRLHENKCDYNGDEKTLMIVDNDDDEVVYQSDGRSYPNNSYPSLFRFDPLTGSKPPNCNKESSDNIDEALSMIKDSIKDVGFDVDHKSFSDFFECISSPANPKETTNNDTVELSGIESSVDFESLLSLLYSKGYLNLRGGQKTDGTWYLNSAKPIAQK